MQVELGKDSFEETGHTNTLNLKMGENKYSKKKHLKTCWKDVNPPKHPIHIWDMKRKKKERDWFNNHIVSFHYAENNTDLQQTPRSLKNPKYIGRILLESHSSINVV